LKAIIALLRKEKVGNIKMKQNGLLATNKQSFKK